MRKLRLVLSICIIVLLSKANAQQPESSTDKVKYCGSGITEYFVPDNFLNCDFKDACKAHDTCYAKCDEGGSKYGTPYCEQSELSPERVKSKTECDTTFRNAIVNNNGQKFLCTRFADAYYFAVKKLGQGPFNGLPIPPSEFNKIVANSKSNKEAFTKLEVLNTLSKSGAIDLAKMTINSKNIQIPIQGINLNNSLVKKNLIIIPHGVDSKQLENLLKEKN